MKARQHEHKFTRQNETVILHKWESEKGKMKPVARTGLETFKQWRCTEKLKNGEPCGEVITFDIDRAAV